MQVQSVYSALWRADTCSQARITRSRYRASTCAACPGALDPVQRCTYICQLFLDLRRNIVHLKAQNCGDDPTILFTLMVGDPTLPRKCCAG